MAVDKNTYKILITGTGIAGKTSLASRIEKDFNNHLISTSYKDVDWDKDALTIPSTNAYILQSPKGCEIEKAHKISPDNFNKILYCNPTLETYTEFLTSRACAWFREGIIEKGIDFNPTPYSIEKLPEIIKRVAKYSATREKLREEDKSYFNKFKSKTRIIIPEIIDSKELFFKNYDKTLEEILSEIRNGN